MPKTKDPPSEKDIRIPQSANLPIRLFACTSVRRADGGKMEVRFTAKETDISPPHFSMNVGPEEKYTVGKTYRLKLEEVQ